MSKMKSLETMLVILLVGMVSLSACSSIREGQLNKLTNRKCSELFIIILELMACGWWAFFNGRMHVLMILWKRVCTAITGGWKRG